MSHCDAQECLTSTTMRDLNLHQSFGTFVQQPRINILKHVKWRSRIVGMHLVGRHALNKLYNRAAVQPAVASVHHLYVNPDADLQSDTVLKHSDQLD